MGDNINKAFNLFGKQDAKQSISTTATTSTTSIARDIVQFADAASGMVSSATASEQNKAQMTKLIEEVRAEGTTPQPDRGKLRTMLESLGKLAGASIGPIAAAGLTAMIQSLMAALG